MNIKSARVFAIPALAIALAAFLSCDLIDYLSGDYGNEDNQTPTASISVSPEYVTSGDYVTISSNPYDADSDQLYFTWYMSGVRQDITDPVVYWTAPTVAVDTEYEVRVSVSDSLSASEASYTIVVHPSGSGNTAPTLSLNATLSDSSTLAANGSVNKGTVVYFTATASDSETPDSLSYSWYLDGNYISGVSVSHYDWTSPSVSYDTSYTITAVVSDGSLSTNQDFRVTVKNNTAPSITSYTVTNALEYSGGGYYAYPEQKIGLTLDIYDAELNADYISWYLNGTLISSVNNESAIVWTVPFPSADTNYLIKAVVSDGYSSVESSQEIYVYNAASIHVVNNGSFDITELYVQPYDGTSSPNASYELLKDSGSVISSGSSYTVWAVTEGYWDVYVYTAGGGNYQTTYNYYYNGGYRVFTISDGSSNLETEVFPSSSVKSVSPTSALGDFKPAPSR